MRAIIALLLPRHLEPHSPASLPSLLLFFFAERGVCAARRNNWHAHTVLSGIAQSSTSRCCLACALPVAAALRMESSDDDDRDSASEGCPVRARWHCMAARAHAPDGCLACQVLLGFVSDKQPATARLSRQHFPSKVGGLPVRVSVRVVAGGAGC